VQEVALYRRVDLEQPQHAPFDPAKNLGPDVEDRRRDLERVVEAAEYKPSLRQLALGTREAVCRDWALAVIGLIAVGKIDDTLRIMDLLIVGNHGLVGN